MSDFFLRFTGGTLVERGRTMRSGPWGSLTITTWGPDRTDPEILRGSAMFPEDHRHLDDESLQAAIDGAKEWVGGRRWSWTIVACNYLRDGRFHA